MKTQLLLQGVDTLQVAYFLSVGGRCVTDFDHLGRLKEELRQSKRRSPGVVTFGGEQFLLHPYGSGSGYPFVLENEYFRIECGPNNSPSFFVTFRSQALWQHGSAWLHEHFMSWAGAAGFVMARPESISRADFSFDYHLPVIDFDENSFVSRSTKDTQYRDSGRVQTFAFGKGDVVLRVYDKVAEIREKSDKVWFYLLWERDSDVWRIEWQVRKPVLRRFGIRTVQDLAGQQGDVLRYLASEHDTLRVPNGDKNRSRWPLHPLWADLQAHIEQLACEGVYRVVGRPAVLDERLVRTAIIMYGYLKRYAAIRCVQDGEACMSSETAWDELGAWLLQGVHDELTWKVDVTQRVQEIELGRW